jgi:hypothetical protein
MQPTLLKQKEHEVKKQAFGEAPGESKQLLRHSLIAHTEIEGELRRGLLGGWRFEHSPGLKQKLLRTRMKYS